MNLIDMDRLRKELMAKGDIPIHEVFNTIWDQPIVNICEVEEQQPCEDCISRKDVIKIFGEVHPLDYNKQSYIANIQKLPSATPKTRWIPVSERLPKENEYIGNVCKYYLVQDEYGDMHVAHLSNVGWIPMDSLKAIGDEVIAWMPLPEGYKEEDE